MSAGGGATEAHAASFAFQAALARIGVATVAELLSLWAGVNPARLEETVARWADDAVNMVMSRRGQSRELAIAYYRLVRALRTGKTVPDPRDPEPPYVTIGELREEFTALIEDTRTGREGARGTPAAEAASTNDQEHYSEAGGPGDDDVIDVEFEFDEDAARELAELERQIAEEDERDEKAARDALEALGKSLGTRLEVLDGDTLTGNQLDEARRKAANDVGAKAAGVAEMYVLNAGRDEIQKRGRRDRRAVGFVRLSSTGTPCGFCAMLISRGAIFYSSRSSAEFRADGEKYHPNCHCYADPIYSEADYDTSPRYALNREYEELWPEVTDGLSGKAARNAWARHFYAQNREAINVARRERTRRMRDELNARRRAAHAKNREARRPANTTAQEASR